MRRAAPLLILLLGAWLRFHALAQNHRFHPDEALFATFARSAAVNGDWLLHGPLDKTPLSIYAIALSMTFTGVVPDSAGVLDLSIKAGEFSARLPGTLASLLVLTLIYDLARRLYRGSTETPHALPLLAMLLAALSPYAIAFGATAFTDGLMLLFMALALGLVARGWWGWSGVALAFSFAGKQQGLFYLPLVIALGLLLETERSSLPRHLIRLTIALVVGTAALLLWDAARAQPTSLFALAAANNTPDHLFARADQILPRLATWLDYGQSLLGPGWLTGLLCILIFCVMVIRFTLQPRDKAARIDAVLLVYILGYTAFYWLTALNLYDRYLLPMLPLMVLLAARAILRLFVYLRDFELKGSRVRGKRRFALTLQTVAYLFFVSLCLCVSVLGFFVLFSAAGAASEGQINVGGDRGKHDGIDRLADWLNSKPVATVIYDRWLGWELGYYLGIWTNKRLTYYPTPQALVKDALALPETAARYFPVPSDENAADWTAALQDAGFGVREVYRSERFVVFELIPPTKQRADASAAGSSSPDQVSCGDAELSARCAVQSGRDDS